MRGSERGLRGRDSAARCMQEDEIVVNKIERPVVSGKESVCIVSEATSFGGTEMHTINLMRALIDDGYGVDLICCGHRQYDRILDDREFRGVRITYVDLSIT